MTPRQRFRIAHRTVRRMVRATRMKDPRAGEAELFAAIIEINRANARPLFQAALRCHQAIGGPP